MSDRIFGLLAALWAIADIAYVVRAIRLRRR